MVGRTIGKYRFVAILGRGGMGTVYRAIDETLDREVAIKVLNPDLMESETVKRFRAEALALAKLNHPRIAHLYELTREEDSLFMVMEYVRGDTFELLSTRSGPLPVDQAIGLCAQALDALHHAHGAGVVHRDLKPANLMLTPSGEVKVMDFGIARVVGSEHLTNDGYMMGTPAYMAPEQVRGEDVDARADVYSMGVVLYRLLTAQLPFKADTAVAMIHSQLNDPPTPSRQHRADVPEWLDAALARSLAKARADRFATAEQFRDALVAGLGGLPQASGMAMVPDAFGFAAPANAADAAPPPIVPPPPASTTSALAGGHTTVTMRRRHAVGAGAVVTLLGAGVAVLAYSVLRSAPETPPPAEAPARPVKAPAPIAAGTATAPATRPADRDATVRETPRPIRDTPLAFRDVKFLTIENAKPKENDAILSLQNGRVVARAEKGPTVFKTMPYRDVVSASYSESKRPTGVAAVFAALKSTKRWLTIQTRDDFMVLNLDKDNVNLIVAAVESRTGVKVQRYLDER